MPIPPLDNRGLLPEGIYNANFAEIMQIFCFNHHRDMLWQQVMNGVLIEKIPVSLDYPLFLAGSFLSDKPNPGDIEMTVQINATNLVFPDTPHLFALCAEDERHRLKKGYRLDFYPYYAQMGNDFSLFFQYVGDKTATLKGLAAQDKRGIVRVTP